MIMVNKQDYGGGIIRYNFVLSMHDYASLHPSFKETDASHSCPVQDDPFSTGFAHLSNTANIA